MQWAGYTFLIARDHIVYNEFGPQCASLNCTVIEVSRARTLLGSQPLHSRSEYTTSSFLPMALKPVMEDLTSLERASIF
jgi:hypothetical protein